MWYDIIERNQFLNIIYSEIPDLVKVRINKMTFDYQQNDINIVIELPEYCSNEPIKWKKQNYNTVVLDLRFCNVSNIEFNKRSTGNKAIIDLRKNGLLINTSVKGDLLLNFNSEIVLVEQINGYHDMAKD